MKYLKPNKPILLWDNKWNKSPKWKTTNAYEELQWMLDELTNNIQADCSEVLVRLSFEYSNNTSSIVIIATKDDFSGYNVGYTDWLEGNPNVYINWICPVSYTAELMHLVPDKE